MIPVCSGLDVVVQDEHRNVFTFRPARNAPTMLEPLLVSWWDGSRPANGDQLQASALATAQAFHDAHPIDPGRIVLGG